jgi:hypothetical protein
LDSGDDPCIDVDEEGGRGGGVGSAEVVPGFGGEGDGPRVPASVHVECTDENTVRGVVPHLNAVHLTRGEGVAGEEVVGLLTPHRHIHVYTQSHIPTLTGPRDEEGGGRRRLSSRAGLSPGGGGWGDRSEGGTAGTALHLSYGSGVGVVTVAPL